MPTPADTITPPQRVQMTCRCQDAAAVPKVVNAGAIETIADGSEVQIMHNGLKMVRGGYYGAATEQIVTTLRGHHEPQEECVFFEMLKHVGPQATMIELGAFWSYYTLWFLKDRPGRRAVAMEPSLHNRAIGLRNAELNNLSPLFVEGFAGRSTTQAQPFAAEQDGIRDIPCLAVETLMTMGGFDHLDVLHCDAQGAELPVLEGCLDLFADGKISWCCVSTHGFPITGDWLTHQRCVACLQQAGAEILAEHDVHESFSGDGFILAKFGRRPDNWVTPPMSYNRYSTSFYRNPIFDLAGR